MHFNDLVNILINMKLLFTNSYADSDINTAVNIRA